MVSIKKHPLALFSQILLNSFKENPPHDAAETEREAESGRLLQQLPCVIACISFIYECICWVITHLGPQTLSLRQFPPHGINKAYLSIHLAIDHPSKSVFPVQTVSGSRSWLSHNGAVKL